MTEEDAFVAAIRAAPGDADARLVFADWLDERGDPRGEYIRLGCQLEGLPASDPRRERALRRKRALLRADPGILAAWERTMALARIRAKLERLRQGDPSFRVFGAEKH